MILVLVMTCPIYAQVPFDRKLDWKWGPSWGAQRPGVQLRPNLEKDRVSTIVTGNGSPFAVELRIWGDVANLEKGKQYQLLYQLRLHTKAGETGPILGTEMHPEGRAFVIGQSTYSDEEFWPGIEGAIDITRKELSGMIGLPAVNEPTSVFVRVEPQLLDVATKKFSTPLKPLASILVLTVEPNRKVTAVTSVKDWIATSLSMEPRQVMESLKSFDEIEVESCRFADGFAKGLERGGIEYNEMAKLIREFPFEYFRDDGNALFWQLEKYAALDSPSELPKAAQEKLDEYRNFHKTK